MADIHSIMNWLGQRGTVRAKVAIKRRIPEPVVLINACLLAHHWVD